MLERVLPNTEASWRSDSWVFVVARNYIAGGLSDFQLPHFPQVAEFDASG